MKGARIRWNTTPIFCLVCVLGVGCAQGSAERVDKLVQNSQTSVSDPEKTGEEAEGTDDSSNGSTGVPDATDLSDSVDGTKSPVTPTSSMNKTDSLTTTTDFVTDEPSESGDHTSSDMGSAEDTEPQETISEQGTGGTETTTGASAATDSESDTSLEVGWCRLQRPSSTSYEASAQSVPIYGRVFVAGCTEENIQCPVLRGELGWGAANFDPSTDPATYRWVGAQYNPQHTNDSNDEFAAVIDETSAGDYGYAYRFTVDDGATWTYCDLDGSDNGFAAAQLGDLTVEPAPPVSWCRLQHPEQSRTVATMETERIYGRAYVSGCTNGAAQCSLIVGQAGYGPAGTNPAVNPDAYVWEDAEYNTVHVSDDNDEYSATLSPQEDGTYSLAYRFSTDEGQTWSYCDGQGSSGQVDVSKLGTLTVADWPIDSCNIQFPETLNAKIGEPSGLIFGRVKVVGCSEGDSRCYGLMAQIGWGERGRPLSEMVWSDAQYNQAHVETDADEYMGALTINEAGTWEFAYRFSGNSGMSWVHCDTTGSADGYSSADAGLVTVGTSASN